MRTIAKFDFLLQRLKVRKYSLSGLTQWDNHDIDFYLEFALSNFLKSILAYDMQKIHSVQFL